MQIQFDKNFYLLIKSLEINKLRILATGKNVK